MLEFDKLYTVEEVAKKTGLTDRTIRNYLKDGKLRGKKVGGQWRFTADDVEALFVTPNEDNAQPENRLGFLMDSPCIKNDPDVCAVVEYTCQITQAKELAARICAEIDNSANGYVGCKFEYTYDEEEGRARYILRGGADFAAAMLKLIKKQTKKI